MNNKTDAEMWEEVKRNLIEYFGVTTIFTAIDSQEVRDDIKECLNFIDKKAKEPSVRETLIKFCDELKDYTAESRNILGHDERESTEIVDIFLKQRSEDG